MSLVSYYRMEARRSLLVAGLSSDPKIIKALHDEAARYNALADTAEADEQGKSEKNRKSSRYRRARFHRVILTNQASLR